MDESLFEDWYYVRFSNYRNSGYDWGYLIFLVDCIVNENDNLVMFLMINIIF